MKIEVLPAGRAMSPPPVKARHRWRLVLAGLLIAALGAGGWAVFQSRQQSATGKAHAPQKGPTPAAPYELSSADVATIQAGELHVMLPLSGTLAPLSQASVKSKVSGVVLETTVQEGMNVAAGQVIARLDSADHKARVAQQQAALDEANARLSLAQKNNANSQALLKQNYISQNAYDTTQNGVELARAAVSAARAQLDLARIALADTTIRAPLAGVVSKRHVQAGEKLAPDMPVFSIVSLLQLTLEAQVPASDIARVRVGQDVAFRVDGYQDRRFAGKVTRINPTTESGSRAILVYISVNNADGALRGGMFAKGELTTDKTPLRPLLPLSALRKDKGQDVVYRIEANTVVAQPVTLGLRNEDTGMAEVSAGLAPGAVVIATPLDAVKPGSRVKVQSPVAPAPAVKKG